MDYARGRQIILHDLRLQFNKQRVVAPKAWWNVEVDHKKDKVADVFAAVATRAKIFQIVGVAELDALHIMAHGYEGSVQLGSEGLHKPTISALSKIAGMFRFVVIHACLVGRPPKGTPAFLTYTALGGTLFPRTAASLTKSSVVVARELQAYSAPKAEGASVGELYFGDWNGPVDVYQDGVPVRTYNQVTDDTFDLEALIFGASKLKATPGRPAAQGR